MGTAADWQWVVVVGVLCCGYVLFLYYPLTSQWDWIALAFTGFVTANVLRFRWQAIHPPLVVFAGPLVLGAFIFGPRGRALGRWLARKRHPHN